MSWQVEWTRQALRATSRLQPGTRRRILDAIETFASSGRGDVKRLKGAHQSLWRIRVGKWRILLSVEDQQVLLIRAVRPRGDAY